MNKFNEIAEEMKKDVESIQTLAREKMEKLDGVGKEKVVELANKTITAVNNTLEKLKDVANKVDDDEKVNDLLDRANAKCKEAVEFTKTKINEILPEEKKEIKIDLDNVLNDIRSSFDKIMKNENVQQATNFVKGIGDSVNEFLSKPEVKEKLDKAKDVTITVAEKGLDVLKSALSPDEVIHVEEKQEENHEEN